MHHIIGVLQAEMAELRTALLEADARLADVTAQMLPRTVSGMPRPSQRGLQSQGACRQTAACLECWPASSIPLGSWVQHGKWM